MKARPASGFCKFVIVSLQAKTLQDIARLHSADLRSRALGGDLGWLNPGDLVPELERAAAALPIR